MKYYVYVYLNPLKPGRYVYESCSFLYQPFYIGYGKNNRLNQHLYNYKNSNSHKTNTISSIILSGNKPIIFKIESGLDTLSAKKLEIEMIRQIGRYDNGTGVLCNKTNGGDSTGYRHNIYTIEKMKLYQSSNHPLKSVKRPEHSLFMKENNPMFCDIVRNKHKQITSSEEYKNRCSIRNMGESNPFYGKEHSIETKSILRDKFSIRVDQIDTKTLSVIKTYESIKSIFVDYPTISLVSECCRGLSLSSAGFYWEYNDIDKKTQYRYIIDNKRLTSRHIRSVIQYDEYNIIFNRYSSIKNASDSTGFVYKSIKKSCINGSTYKGFKWGFE